MHVNGRMIRLLGRRVIQWPYRPPARLYDRRRVRAVDAVPERRDLRCCCAARRRVPVLRVFERADILAE